MIAFGIYIVFFPVCLSFNFTDFKVINSDIANNYYQLSLASENNFNDLGSEDDSRRRMLINDLLNDENEEYFEIDRDGTKIKIDKPIRRRLSQTGNYTLWTHGDFFYRAIARIYLNVFFYSKKTNNILTNELLDICHKIERQIKLFDGYDEHSLIYKEEDDDVTLLLGESPAYLESAPGSFLNYIYPETVFGNYIFNGNGHKLTLQGDIEETIRTLEKNDEIGDVTEFFDFSFNFINVSSKYLAAVYPFSFTDGNETKDELYSWVGTYKTQLFDKLENIFTCPDDDDGGEGCHLKRSMLDDVGIAVADSRGVILEEELYFYLGKDLNLAIWSLIIIYVVVYIYCRSFYITTLGLLGVCSSFIPCFAIYEMVWGESFNLVNMVSIWVILGIGCDDICVFMSSYRRAPLESINGEIIPNYLRLAFAYREAGAAMFVTSFTTSCSFFSLCLSTINPLPQFGWFLGSLVLTNFILVMTWFPCILQSYVWFVMFLMKYGCHIPQCTKWLAVAVPLPEQYNVKQDSIGFKKHASVKVLKRSSSKNNQLMPNMSVDNMGGNSPISEQDIDGQTPLYGRQLSRQQSSKFAVPGATSPSSEPSIIANARHSAAPSQLVRQLTRKLDKNTPIQNGGFEAQTQFGDCTNLYFVIMRRFVFLFFLHFSSS